MTILQQFQDEFRKLPVFNILRETIRQSGVPAFLIGGYVRDLLLNRPCKDIDITVIGDGIQWPNVLRKRLGKKVK